MVSKIFVIKLSYIFSFKIIHLTVKNIVYLKSKKQMLMKRKQHLTRLFLVIVTLLSMSSCVRDDLAAESQSQKNSKNMSSKFASRSFWKEDNIYINKVQQVFLKVANLEHVRTRYGELNWDYSMTFGNFNETYALVPVIRDNKVVLLMEAVRTGNKVFFYEKDNKDLIKFFNLAMYSNVTKYDEVIETKGGILSKTPAFVCTTRWLTIGCFDNETDCVPYTTSVTNCEYQGGSGIPPKTFDPIGMDGGGDGNNGYEYPEIPEIIDPCLRLRSKFTTDIQFKAKVAAIDKQEVFAYDHEMGFAAGYPPANTTVTETQYQPMENTIGSHNVMLPDGNQYFGFIHSHNNLSNGGHPVKIFSPADLATFLTSCVANADAHGSIDDAYAMVITSGGNYILQFTGTSSGFGLGPNTIIWWKKWYKENADLIKNEDGSITQDKTEKLFLQFLKEKVKIDGVELYKVDKVTGKSNKLSLNTANVVVPTPCP